MKRVTVIKWLTAIGGAALSLTLFMKRFRDKGKHQPQRDNLPA